MKNLVTAIEEYHLRASGHVVSLTELDNGFFAPPADDTCPLCEGAQWSCSTGAHLKTIEHVALKNELEPKILIKAIHIISFNASEIAWKQLLYTPSSYLRSGWDNGELVWLPSETTEAYCHYGCENGPEESCSCGIYGLWSPFAAHEYYATKSHVTVQMQVGGVVIEGSKGCRAQ